MVNLLRYLFLALFFAGTGTGLGRMASGGTEDLKLPSRPKTGLLSMAHTGLFVEDEFDAIMTASCMHYQVSQ
jgi:hypothetical protein